ncbi:hypothetical protein QQX98_006825 [Neonectria punicea]|uniref:Uncharacterized protein n=1 Tax=Neonectria punicea TaxID=979145 RepID=A0ABR1GZQ1_9HYPO
MIVGILSLLAKLLNVPDLDHIQNAIVNPHTETKTATEHTARAISTLREELNAAARAIQTNTAAAKDGIDAAQAANSTAKEALETGKMTLKMARDMKAQGPMNQGNVAQTYASVVARGGLAASIHNPRNQRTSPIQTLREIIVNIRDPVTIANIRAMSPRSLKAHVDRAIEQSSNENIDKLRAVSANQLKSGDLSIKTATTADIEALRQFAEDWESRIGNGATLNGHGSFADLQVELLRDNKPFIPTAEIKHMSWLTRSSANKSASSVIVEFLKAEDANKIIDEELIWQGEEPSARQRQHAATARKSMRLESDR